MYWTGVRTFRRCCDLSLQGCSVPNDPASLSDLLPVQPSTAAVAAAHLRQTILHAIVSFHSYTEQLTLPHALFFFNLSNSAFINSQAALAAAGSLPSAPMTTVGQYPPVPPHQVPVPAPMANQNPIDNLPANQNPAQDAAFINPVEANQNMRMNAQGGPVMEDEEDVERDWLDCLYSAARFGVLLMIVYFNSNLSRFLLVMSTLLLMYL